MHRKQAARRTKSLREVTRYAWLAAGKPRPPTGAFDVTITCIREAPRMLDAHDNLPPAFKAIVDEAVDCLGYADDSARSGLAFAYQQIKAPASRVRIEVTWSGPS